MLIGFVFILIIIIIIINTINIIMRENCCMSILHAFVEQTRLKTLIEILLE